MHAFSLYILHVTVQIWIMLIDVTSTVTPEGKHHERSTLPAKWSAHDLFHTIAHLLSKHLDHSNKARCPRQPEAKEQDVPWQILAPRTSCGRSNRLPKQIGDAMVCPKTSENSSKNYKFFNVMPFVSGIYGPPNVVLSFPQPPMTGPVTEDVGEYFAVCDTCNDRGRHVQRPNALELRHSGSHQILGPWCAATA